MDNHFHLVVETPKGNLVAGLKWFLGTYKARFNRRHKLLGRLFSKLQAFHLSLAAAAAPPYFLAAL